MKWYHIYFLTAIFVKLINSSLSIINSFIIIKYFNADEMKYQFDIL